MSGQNTSFQARVVLRPRSLDETFDLAIRYLRTALRDFSKLLVVFTAILTGGIVAVSWFFELAPGPQAALAFLTVPFYERVVTAFAGRHLFSNPISIFGAIRTVAKRLPFLVVHAGFCAIPALMICFENDDSEGLLAGFGIMLAVAWAVFILPMYIHVTEVLLLEQLPSGHAMRRSRTLISQRFGRALGTMLFSLVVRGCIVAMIYFGMNFIVGFVLQFEGVSENIGSYFAILGYVVAAPYVALARLFDYVDARTRREGWDIQVRFNAIAQRYAREEADRLAA